MNIDQKKIIDNVRQAQILNAFKKFADGLSSDPKLRQTFIRLQHENKNCLQRFFYDRFNFKLQDDEVEYMNKLVQAYLRKNVSRTKILSNEGKIDLLNKQNYRCAFCGVAIDIHAPIDHIIPFKYVGDKLDDNYQLLCKSCNSKKNKSFDYQIKFILEGGYQ